jgi:glutamine synthetase
MNTIVAESLDFCASELEKATGGDPGKLNAAVQKLLTQIITEASPIVFNGDGYSDAWHQEAAKRGLLNLKTSVDALPALQNQEIKELFSKYNVLSERELESRFEIYLEQYCKTVCSEANLTLEMAKTLIFPAAIRYQNELASTCANLKLVGYEFDTETLDKVTELVKNLQDSISVLSMAVGKCGHGEGVLNAAAYCCSDVLPSMAMVRKYADELEGWVADDLWPLPTYQEMLFIK